MSTGETPPSATARFSSPININNSNTTKKYPGGGTPKSPMLNSGTSGKLNYAQNVFDQRANMIYLFIIM